MKHFTAHRAAVSEGPSLFARLLLLLVVAAGSARASFGPNVRVDHDDRASHGCYHAAITTGNPGSGPQPIYVAIENDSLAGITEVRSDIYFQRSLDNGQTWLPEDRLVRLGAQYAGYPDIAVDRSGNIYVIYSERVAGSSGNGHCYVVRSGDGGLNWSSPSQVDDNASATPVGWGRIVADTAGRLFAAWNDSRTGYQRIWSSVSTDSGVTWRANVRVDDDTVSSDEFHADVAVQPGTNAYLVTATYPYFVRPGNISSHAMCTQSRNGGQSFAPCVILDTFSYYCAQPHVIADSGHIICDFTGSASGSSNQEHTQAATSSDSGRTWTGPAEVTELDTLYSSYYNGAHLAIDAIGSVHVGLMVCDLLSYNYDVYYARSFDHGLTWTARERVNDGTSGYQGDPDIAADAAGDAFVVWQDERNSRDEIWFAASNVMTLTEDGHTDAASNRFRLRASPTLFRDQVRITVMSPAEKNPGCEITIYDTRGSAVRMLKLSTNGRRFGIWNGTDNQGRRCPPGVYLITAGSATAAATKVVLLN